ncbi:hypothetical protein PENTCL1PPCAC_23794, partial [Pristionchus entomophagus]
SIVVRKSTANNLYVSLSRMDNNFATMKSVDVACECKLNNHNDDAKTVNIKSRSSLTFDEKHQVRVLPQLIYWKSVISEGFIKDNKITLQIQFSLSNILRPRSLSCSARDRQEVTRIHH